MERLKSAGRRFYVYQLSKPDGTPFYIGKGMGRRVFSHEREALGPDRSHKLNTIRKLRQLGWEIHYELLAFFDDESDCHVQEIAEILRIGRHDLGTGPLTNLTEGGEGACGLSEETKARIDVELHSADAPGDRGIANRFFFQLCSGVASVPVRPFSAGKPRALAPLPVHRTPTLRMAAALAASAIANRVLVEPGCILPRRMTVEDRPMIIEYGASTNILQAGMATLVDGAAPTYELFKLSSVGYGAILEHIGKAILLDAGVLMPEG